ncbi:MAG: NUDIX hydrolase [Solirubrobacterales bacterium]|jgi:8-oxo-dGTP pyrophosphatase MutT (NUDIX family)|nr:NUDIX hydrolase [Solirubrobacterales bacterium]
MAEPPPIRTLSSREVYRSPWMRLREDEIVLPDGSPGRYGVVEKPDFALIIPFDGERFHLVEQFRYPVGERCIEFPQGAWEGTATPDAADLARGELEEETGLLAAGLRHLGRLFHAYGFCSQSFDVFFATELTPGQQRLEPTEQGLRTLSVDRGELERMVLDGTLRDGPSVAAYGLLRLHD